MNLLALLTVLSALGCGLMAGTFFAFSSFVMRGLARVAPERGIAAMQAINVAVMNPVFLSVFMGTTVLCLGLGIFSIVRWSGPGAAALLVGSLLYFGGNFVVTAVCNVPRNEALARFEPASAEAVRYWQEYVVSWTRWNHVRTVTALLAAGAFTIALCQMRPSP